MEKTRWCWCGLVRHQGLMLTLVAEVTVRSKNWRGGRYWSLFNTYLRVVVRSQTCKHWPGIEGSGGSHQSDDWWQGEKLTPAVDFYLMINPNRTGIGWWRESRSRRVDFTERGKLYKKNRDEFFVRRKNSVAIDCKKEEHLQRLIIKEDKYWKVWNLLRKRHELKCKISLNIVYIVY